MRSTFSKRILQRQRRAELLVAAAQRVPSLVEKGLAERLKPVLGEGEALVEVKRVFEALALEVDRRVTALVALDDAHAAFLTKGGAARGRRDAEVLALCGSLSRIRQAVAVTYGNRVATNLLGVKGRLTRKPHLVLAVAQRVLGRVAAGLRLPARSLTGVHLLPELWVAELEGPAARLEELLVVVARARSGAQASQAQKQRDLETFDAFCRDTERFLAATFRLAGAKQLIPKLRPPRTRGKARPREQAEVPAPARGLSRVVA